MSYSVADTLFPSVKTVPSTERTAPKSKDQGFSKLFAKALDEEQPDTQDRAAPDKLQTAPQRQDDRTSAAEPDETESTPLEMKDRETTPEPEEILIPDAAIAMAIIEEMQAAISAGASGDLSALTGDTTAQAVVETPIPEIPLLDQDLVELMAKQMPGASQEPVLEPVAGELAEGLMDAAAAPRTPVALAKETLAQPGTVAKSMEPAAQPAPALESEPAAQAQPALVQTETQVASASSAPAPIRPDVAAEESATEIAPQAAEPAPPSKAAAVVPTEAGVQSEGTGDSESNLADDSQAGERQQGQEQTAQPSLAPRMKAAKGVKSMAAQNKGTPQAQAEAESVKKGPAPARTEGQPEKTADALQGEFLQAMSKRLEPGALEGGKAQSTLSFVPQEKSAGLTAASGTQATVASRSEAASGTLSKLETLQTFIENVDKHLLSLVRDGQKSLTVTLVPEKLGKVVLQCSEEGGQLRVDIQAQNGEVRDLLQRQEGSLKTLLEQNGFKLGQFDVHTQAHAEGRADRESQRQQAAEEREQRPQEGRRPAASNETGRTATPSQVASGRAEGRQGLWWVA